MKTINQQTQTTRSASASASLSRSMNTVVNRNRIILAESLPTFQRKPKRVKTSILSIVSWLLLLTFAPAVDLAVAVPLRPL